MAAVRRDGPEVSIEQMAEQAGVSKPVLYAEFGGKYGLVDAMAVQLADGVERTVVARLSGAGTYAPEAAIAAIVEALVDLIEAEPQLYAYIVRNLRTSDRGLLDNALVRVIHERASLVIGHMAKELRPDELRLLTDGVFGFLFAAVESWTSTRKPDKATLVSTATTVIQAGLRAAVAGRRTARAVGA